MDNAGRKLLLSIILKNTGIHTPFHLACVQVLLITLIFAQNPPQTTDTLPYSAHQYAAYLGIDFRTISKYANSITEFTDLKPNIQKKKTASNRWEAREVN